MDPNRIDRRSTEWDFYGIVVKVGLPLTGLAVLFVLARKGDTAAIIVLAVLGAVVLLSLGVVAALAFIDRMARIEQMRFQDNARENMAILMQQQRMLNAQLRAQGRQARDLLTQNEQLARQLPSGDEDLDVDALVWDEDLIDLEL